MAIAEAFCVDRNTDLSSGVFAPETIAMLTLDASSDGIDEVA